MRRALSLARRGIPLVTPNPPVGALVVRKDTVVGRGWHHAYGGSHAEVFALEEAKELAAGATLYVTLEPCNHHGKTPPCVEAVLAAGIARVVICCKDPNPKVNGRGAEALLAAGVQVDFDCESQKGMELLRPWVTRVTKGRPFRAFALARLLDGRFLSLSSPSEQALLSIPARAHLSRLLGRYQKEGVFILPDHASLQNPDCFQEADSLSVYGLPLFDAPNASILEMKGIKLHQEHSQRVGANFFASYSVSRSPAFSVPQAVLK